MILREAEFHVEDTVADVCELLVPLANNKGTQIITSQISVSIKLLVLDFIHNTYLHFFLSQDWLYHF